MLSPRHGKIAFSYTESDVLGITSDLSIPIISPYPSHFGQAP